MDGYHVLANAIIIRAVEDYRDAIKTLKKHPKDRKAMDTALEIEEFFRSEWYKVLTGADAKKLLDRLRREAVK